MSVTSIAAESPVSNLDDMLLMTVKIYNLDIFKYALRFCNDLAVASMMKSFTEARDSLSELIFRALLCS